MLYIITSKIAIFVKIVKIVIEAKRIKMLKMNVMTTITMMMNLMTFVFVVTSIINCQYINTVSIRMLSASTINARKEIISSRTVVRKTMIYIKKRVQKKTNSTRATKRSRFSCVTSFQSKFLLTTWWSVTVIFTYWIQKQFIIVQATKLYSRTCEQLTRWSKQLTTKFWKSKL